MPVQRLNHAVLYVRDVERSLAFYRDVLGFRVKVEIPGRAVFLQAEGSTNDHDLGLFAIGAGAGPSQAGRATVGLYHLAWEVDTLAELSSHSDPSFLRLTTRSVLGRKPTGAVTYSGFVVEPVPETPQVPEEALSGTPHGPEHRRHRIAGVPGRGRGGVRASRGVGRSRRDAALCVRGARRRRRGAGPARRWPWRAFVTVHPFSESFTAPLTRPRCRSAVPATTPSTDCSDHGAGRRRAFHAGIRPILSSAAVRRCPVWPWPSPVTTMPTPTCSREQSRPRPTGRGPCTPSTSTAQRDAAHHRTGRRGGPG